MSLLVRLPLNGNLNNYGSADVTVTVTGTTSYADGRAGKALSCNGSSYWTVTGVTLGSEASIACWSKTSTNGKMSWVLVSSVSDRLNLYESSQYCLNTGDGNSNLFKDSGGNAINCLHDNQWHHFVVTFGNSVAKLYIDGVYRGTATTFKSPATTSANTIKLAGGYANGHSYDWNGLISDFRVYNHCLTESEIIQLIKGKGLQVWLPLTEDLRQQGLSNAIATNNGATFDSSGKLGGCYSFNSNYIRIPDVIIPKTTWSAACWFYPTSDSSGGHQYLVSMNTSASNDFIFTLCFYQNKFSVRTAGTTYQGSAAALNTWHHIAATFDGTNLKLYANGVLVLNQVNPAVPVAATTVFCGMRGGGAGYFTGKLNDVRIYDYALSSENIKELSKGLVLHYLLNRGGLGQENLLRNTDFGGVSKKYTITSGTEGGFTYTPTETIIANTEYIVSCRLRGNANMNLYKLCTGGNEVLNWVDRSQLSTTEYRPFSIVFTYPSSKTLNQIYICTRYGTSNTSTGDWFEIEPYSLKLEKGSLATPWCPNSSDALATTLGLNETIEYDCSGFCNNGTRTGTFTWTSDTPKYNVSTYFPNTTTTTTFDDKCWITVPFILNNINQLTVSFWFKKEAITRGGLFTTNVATYTGTDLTVDDYDNSVKIRASDGTSVTLGSYDNLIPANTWCHWVVTFDGINIKVYVNSILKNTVSYSVTKMLKNITNITLGANKAGGVYRTAKGNYSDFRIYATDLSADDIAELYNGGVL